MTTPTPNLPSLSTICTILLASQYRQPNIEGIIQSICGIASLTLTLQGTFSAIATQPYTRFINNAVGVQLDGIGDIIGLKRLGGEDDESYRSGLKVQISTIRSSGTYEQVYDTVQNVVNPVGSGNNIVAFVKERFPMHVIVIVYAAFSALPSVVSRYVQPALAAPVSATLICTNGVENPFKFGGGYQPYLLEVNGEIYSIGDAQNTPLTINVFVTIQSGGFGESQLASIIG